MLVRSWNLFHGNTVPPGRHAYLDEMVSLATADDPDVLCVQEVPAWALPRFSVGDQAAAPSFGPLPIPADGRSPAHRPEPRALPLALRRSRKRDSGGVSRASSCDHDVATLNPRFLPRRPRAPCSGLDVIMRLAWAKERRVVQTARLAHDDGRTVRRRQRALHELPRLAHPGRRALNALRSSRSTCAEPDDVVVLAGDFNVIRRRARLRSAGRRLGLLAAGAGHRPRARARRRAFRAARLGRAPATRSRPLSDHAPVELEIR